MHSPRCTPPRRKRALFGDRTIAVDAVAARHAGSAHDLWQDRAEICLLSPVAPWPAKDMTCR